jgi:ribonuclease BN (tRNA processing enzyme)
MHIKILGARAEIDLSKPHYLKHAGLLINNEILCDAGEKEFLNYDPLCILITHLHPDHAFFIREKVRQEIAIWTVAPENPGQLDFLHVATSPFTFGKYKITPIPTVHSLKVKSQGYLIEKDNKRVFYSGDVAGIDPNYYHQLQNLDAVITEASFIRRGGVVRKNALGYRYGHTGVPDLIQLFKQFTRHIIFTHFGTWFLKDTEKGKIKIKALVPEGVTLDIGYDGKVFEI